MRLEQLRGLDPDRLDLLQVRAFPLEAPWVRVRLRVPPWVRVRLREEEEWALPWGLQEMAWDHRVNLDQEMVRNREGKGTRVLEERVRAPAWEEVRKERGMGSEAERLEREQDQRREREQDQRLEREQGQRQGREQDQRLGREQDQRSGAGTGQRLEREQDQRLEREQGQRQEREQDQRRGREQGHQQV